MALREIMEKAMVSGIGEEFTDYLTTLYGDYLNSLSCEIDDKTTALCNLIQEQIGQENYHFWEIFDLFVKIKKLVNNDRYLLETPNHGIILVALGTVLKEQIEVFLMPEENAGAPVFSNLTELPIFFANRQMANLYNFDNLIELLNTVPNEYFAALLKSPELADALDMIFLPDQIAGIINHLEPERQEAFCFYITDRDMSEGDTAFNMDDFIIFFSELKGNERHRRQIYDYFESALLSRINACQDLAKIERIIFLDPQRKAAILEEKAPLIRPHDPYIRCADDLASLFNTFRCDQEIISDILFHNEWLTADLEIMNLSPLANITKSRREFVHIYHWLDLSKNEEALTVFLKALNENGHLSRILKSQYDFSFLEQQIGLQPTLSLLEHFACGYITGVQRIYYTCLNAMNLPFIRDKSAAFENAEILLQEIRENPQGLIAKAHELYFKHLFGGIMAENGKLTSDIENLCTNEMGFKAVFKNVDRGAIRQSLIDMTTPEVPLLDQEERVTPFQLHEESPESSGFFSSFSGFSPFSR